MAPHPIGNHIKMDVFVYNKRILVALAFPANVACAESRNHDSNIIYEPL
jgi:hypothetical protein